MPFHSFQADDEGSIPFTAPIFSMTCATFLTPFRTLKSAVVPPHGLRTSPRNGDLMMRAALLVLLLLAAGCARAQETNAATDGGAVVPDNLKHLFNLPWCRAWQIGCYECTKKDGRLSCEKDRSDCARVTPGYFQCVDFNVDEYCDRFAYDCNVCNKMGGGGWACTAMGCDWTRPRFTCLSPRPSADTEANHVCFDPDSRETIFLPPVFDPVFAQVTAPIIVKIAIERIVSQPWSDYRWDSGIPIGSYVAEANVLQVLRGTVDSKTVLIVAPGSDCDDFLKVGLVGYVAGRLQTSRDGVVRFFAFSRH